MSPRKRLPNRRRAETIDIYHNGQKVTLTIGFDDDNHMAEVFVSTAKAGSEMEAAARDAGIQISLAVQNGITLESLDHSLTINPDGTPSSLIGAVVKAMLNWPEPLSFVLKPDEEIVPAGLRSLHRWGPRHDKIAKRVMEKFGWKLPADRERIYRETWLRIRPKKLYDGGRSSAEVDAAELGEPLTREPMKETT